MGLDERWKDAEQLQLLVQRVVVEQVSMSKRLVPTPSQPPLQPHPYYATTGLQLSDATVGPDLAQLDLLCPPTRAGGAALRGRTSTATGSTRAARAPRATRPAARPPARPPAPAPPRADPHGPRAHV